MNPAAKQKLSQLTLHEAAEIVTEAAGRDAFRLSDSSDFYIQMEAIRIVARHINNSPEDYS